MRSLSGPEASQRISSLLEQRKDQYSDALVEALIFKEGDKLRPYFVRIQIRRQGAAAKEEFTNEYAGVTLLRKRCALTDVGDLVEKLVNEKKLVLDGLTLEADQGRAYLEERGLISSDKQEDAVGWAHISFRASLMNGGSYPHAPLIANGLPSFPDAMYAARFFFGVDLDHNSGRQGTLTIVLPHYGARISKIGFQKRPARLRIGIEPGASPLSDFILKGWYTHDRHDESLVSQDLKKSNTFKVSGKPNGFAFWLIHKETGEIVDERSHLYGGRPEFGEEAEDAFSSASINAMLKGGESDTVEYKQADTKKKDDPFNAQDIAKEIVAFSNHKGGIIFLGVNDDCEVVGLEQPNRLRDWVSNIATNSCKPAITVQYKSHEVAGRKIGMIIVSKGTPGTAYQRNDGKTFVRRLGSSRPADPHEIQLLTRLSMSPAQHAFGTAQGFR